MQEENSTLPNVYDTWQSLYNGVIVNKGINTNANANPMISVVYENGNKKFKNTLDFIKARCFEEVMSIPKIDFRSHEHFLTYCYHSNDRSEELQPILDALVVISE